MQNEILEILSIPAFCHIYRYDIVKNQWTQITSLQMNQYDATSIAFAGGIFVIGGRGSGLKYLRSVDCYVPAFNKWIPIAPMKHKRSKARAAVFNEELYVFGGFSDGAKMLSSIEKYNCQTNEWTVVRHNFLFKY